MVIFLLTNTTRPFKKITPSKYHSKPLPPPSPPRPYLYATGASPCEVPGHFTSSRTRIGWLYAMRTWMRLVGLRVRDGAVLYNLASARSGGELETGGLVKRRWHCRH